MSSTARDSTTRNAFHKTPTLPEPIGFMAFEPPRLHGLADTILTRLRKVRNDTSAGCYLLGGPRREIYLLAEESTTGHALVRQHQAWVVARYAASTDRATGAVLYPNLADIIDDLRAHYAGGF